MTTALRTGRRLVMASLLIAAAVGCAGSGGASEASCAYLVTYDSRTYLDVANVDFTVGEKLGTATIPECDDTPNTPGDTVPERTITAYEVEGMDPAVTIAVGDTAAEAILMQVR
ncbi:DUF6281 family protein [Streptomyces sp. DT2A-34]|uniref:DUF6281 family protein n=1 Tax=Streptomyces sp. DT2A-34 TaxID=3051182 RepID=UPI00265C7270|nr:DUF6281 family protein [Streptomyces sp. DT2A-34]MDO0912230.1 DUF6281 family protein [Streptomyces sp. DT2A-34]